METNKNNNDAKPAEDELTDQDRIIDALAEALVRILNQDRNWVGLSLTLYSVDIVHAIKRYYARGGDVQKTLDLLADIAPTPNPAPVVQ